MKTALALGAGLSLLAISGSALAQRKASQTEYTPEEYSEEGQTNGCGVSFLAVWPADGGEIIGVSGSANFFIVPEHKNVMAMIKATAVMNGRPTPVSYAWLETPSYGRSNDFAKGPAKDPGSFIGVKNSDAKAMALVMDVAHSGSIFGVTLKGRALDDSVKLPAPSQDVATKVMACFDRLNTRMQATFR